MSKTALLAEPSPIVRAGVAHLLEQTDRYRIVGQTTTIEEAFKVAIAHSPDVLIAPVHLVGGTSIALARRLRDFSPNTAVVILSQYSDQATVRAAFKCGVAAYCLASQPVAELLHGIDEAAAGRRFVSPAIELTVPLRTAAGSHRFDRLTPRELQVLRLMNSGQANKEIAVGMGIGIWTVRGYRKTLMRKVGAFNAASLIAAAHRAGIFDGPPPR